MLYTPFHAYFTARQLGTLARDETLLPVFASSAIDMYPFQVAAARFAMRSQYIKGCILCDEGSLGKTYETLLIASQRWYEGKDRLLLILPKNLINQWITKIENGFSVPYSLWSNGCELPETDGIIITTYDVALRQSETISSRTWDMVIFDEADALFKPENKTVTTLKAITAGAFKLLLTPTPITMSVMDIYGLIHFIDESVLPNADDFYKRYFRKPENYHELTSWVSQFAFRTLKNQVAEYVNFTERLPITVDYSLSPLERKIYAKVQSYLALPSKAAYPDMDSYELNLMYFHVLSSSPKALCRTLDKAISRLEEGIERVQLEEIRQIADKVDVSGKMKALQSALDSCSTMLKSHKLPRKAVIFTNNLITLDLLADWLTENRYAVITSRDPDYIERFRNEKTAVLIATDTAAKGLDMEFCPVIINYDLLYNAVEMEQRISRCHRQGQLSDVIVVNLLSKENLSDVRILELINKRTLQFDGIFGMSDDIVGNFDIAIDEMLAQVRKPADIQEAFENNLVANESENKGIVSQAEDTLFTTFTKTIADKVVVTPQYISDKTTAINSDLWELAKYFFSQRDDYEVSEQDTTITLTADIAPRLFYYWSGKQSKPYKGMKKYSMAKDFKPIHGKITLTSIIGRGVINEAACADTGTVIVSSTNIEPCEIGLYEVILTSGLEGLASYDVLVGITETGEVLPEEQCKKIFKLPVHSFTENGKRTENWLRGVTGESTKAHQLDYHVSKESAIERYNIENSVALEEEVERIKLRAMRKKTVQEHTLNDLQREIKSVKNEMTANSGDRLKEYAIEKNLKELEKQLRGLEQNLFFEQMKIDVATEKEIEALTKNTQIKARIRRHFIIKVVGHNG